MDHIIIRKIVYLLAIAFSSMTFASTEVSFEIKKLPVHFKPYKKQLLLEPFEIFMNNPQFIYRIGSKTNRHIQLKHIEKETYILKEGEKEIARTALKSDQPEVLATFVRFELFKYFMGENEFLIATREQKLTAASAAEYPRFERVAETIVKPTGPVVVKRDLPQDKPVAMTVPSPKLEPMAKTEDGVGQSSPVDKKSLISKIFEDQHFPLLFSFGAVFGGDLNPSINTSGALKGLELAVGAHLKSDWSLKLYNRYFTARDNESRPYLEQKMIGLLAMKSLANSSFYLLGGFAREELNKNNKATEVMNKLVAGVGLSFFGWFSLEARSEAALKSYSAAYQNEVNSGFQPVFILNFGHYL